MAPQSLPVAPGAFSGIAIDRTTNVMLLVGDDSSTIQPSLLFQLPMDTFDLPTTLPLLWNQADFTLISARAGTLGVDSKILLACVDGHLAAYDGPQWANETLLRPVPYMPATYTSGVDCTTTAASVSTNLRTGSVALGIRQNWHSVKYNAPPSAPGQPVLASTSCQDGFRPSALLRGPDFAKASPTTLPTNMQVTGIFVGPILAPCSDDVVVVGSSDNTSIDLASLPLLFPNGDSSRAVALTAQPLQGRSVAVADISGNGLPDIFIVGTGQYHCLLLQRAVGLFVEQHIPTGVPPGTFRGVSIGRVFNNPRTMEVVLTSVAVGTNNVVLTFVQPCFGNDINNVAPATGTTLAALAALPAAVTPPSPPPRPRNVTTPVYWAVVGVLAALLVAALVVMGLFVGKSKSTRGSTKPQANGKWQAVRN